MTGQRDSEEPRQRLTTRGWLALAGAAVVLGVGVAVMVGSGSDDGGMRAGGTLPETAGGGEAVDVAVIVTDVRDPDLLECTVLRDNGDGSFSRTDLAIDVRWDGSQPVVMGSPGDVRRDAVLQVEGTTLADGTVQASQVTILTGFVQLTGG